MSSYQNLLRSSSCGGYTHTPPVVWRSDLGNDMESGFCPKQVQSFTLWASRACGYLLSGSVDLSVSNLSSEVRTLCAVTCLLHWASDGYLISITIITQLYAHTLRRLFSFAVFCGTDCTANPMKESSLDHKGMFYLHFPKF